MMKNTFCFLLILLSLYSVTNAQDLELHITELDNQELRLNMQNNGTAFLNEVNLAFHEGRVPEFESNHIVREAELGVLEMWNTSPFYIIESTIIENVARLTSGFYEVRNIPVHFVDPLGETHYQDAVIQFTPTGMVRDFKIGLEAHRYQDIVRQGLSLDDVGNRRMILSFVEDFRTSYNRKDIDFIEKVFSDQALIIVGRVLESTGERSPYENARVELLQFTKEEYIERLRGIFSRNEWIDVTFEDIEIRVHPQHEHLYGVYLSQYYRSSTYADEGYLFTLIDFRNREEPQIHVRTWEPKREVQEAERFSLGDINIY